MTPTVRDLTIRPKRELSHKAVLIALLTGVPLFAVLHWYTATCPEWQYLVLAVQLTLLLTGALTLWRQSKVFTRVAGGRLEGNGIYSAFESVALDGISRIVMVRVFRSSPDDAVTQLIAVGEDDECLYRLRGQFWHLADFRLLADGIAKPVTTRTLPLSESEFFETFPGSAYWYERTVRARLSLVAAIVLLVGMTLLALFGLIQLVRPVFWSA